MSQAAIIDFPEIHFIQKCSCDSTEWMLLYPKDDPKEWYIRCMECQTEFHGPTLIEGYSE